MPRIGAFNLHAIDAGTLRLDGGAMFGIVPRTLWERRMKPDARGRITLQMRCLLLEGEDRLMLIDTGAGTKTDEKFNDWFALKAVDPGEAIVQAGFLPDEVTDVILTHLHFDHAGGSTWRKGESIVPRFKNATYYVQRAQLESARAPNAREAGSFLPENIEPLSACGQLHTLDGPCNLVRGVDLNIVHGHTDAQQLVRVSGNEGSLVFVADLIPTIHHVRPPWIMAYDVRPLVTVSEKRAFLDEAAEHSFTVFFEHDPVIEIANVISGEQGVRLINPRLLTEL